MKLKIKSKEELAAIVERVISSEEENITVEIPKSSLFGRSILNFQLLKRESESAGKNITIFSENKEVVQMAADVGFEIDSRVNQDVTPSKGGAKSMSDIVPPDVKDARDSLEGEQPKKKKSTKRMLAVGKKLFTRQSENEDDSEEKDSEDELQEEMLEQDTSSAEPAVDQSQPQEELVDDSTEGDDELVDELDIEDGVLEDSSIDEQKTSAEENIDRTSDRDIAISKLFSGSDRDQEESAIEERVTTEATYDPMEQSFMQKMAGFIKKAGIVVVVGIAVIGLAYIAFGVLPKATIDITMKRFDWSFNDAVEASTEFSEPQVDPPSIPLEIITLTKNIDLDVPATGKEDVSTRAKGTITIYNEFSSDPQTLVARTRFLTPDNKLYRLDNAITVPGAKIVDGEIERSSIEARVTADQPGEEFNIGPVEHFTIPGFEGGPRYEKFYAESFEPMSGGFIGEATVVTEGDLESARERAAEVLTNSSQMELEEKVPADFHTIEGLRKVDFTELEFSHEVGDVTDSIQVTADINMQTGYFKEEDLISIFRAKAREALGFELEIRNSSLEYGVARADFVNGTASFPVQYGAEVARKVDVAALRNDLAGKGATQTKSVIFGVPGLESANIKFWPIWVKSTPDDHEKIEINVN